MHESAFARQVGLHHVWNESRCWLQHVSLRTFFYPRLSFCTDCQTKIRNNIEKKNRMLWLMSWRPNMRKYKHSVWLRLCVCAHPYCLPVSIEALLKANDHFSHPVPPCVFWSICALVCPNWREEQKIYRKTCAFQARFFTKKTNKNEWCLKSRLRSALKRCGDGSSFLKTH